MVPLPQGCTIPGVYLFLDEAALLGGPSLGQLLHHVVTELVLGEPDSQPGCGRVKGEGGRWGKGVES